MWKTLSAGTIRLSSGATAQTTSRAATNALQPARLRIAGGVGSLSGATAGWGSRITRPSPEGDGRASVFLNAEDAKMPQRTQRRHPAFGNFPLRPLRFLCVLCVLAV